VRLVLDTNALVSGLLTAGNPPGRIVDLLRAGKIQLQVDERIVAEYGGVLSRPKFRKKISPFQKDLVMDFINPSFSKIWNNLVLLPMGFM